MDHAAPQPNILEVIPLLCRALYFSLRPGAAPAAALRRLRDAFGPADGIVGIGEPLVRALHVKVPGLRTFPA